MSSEKNIIKSEIKKKKEQNMTLIEFKQVTKIYKRGVVEVTALNSLVSEFYAGEISVIIGPSGCGKTTLLNAIGGLISISAGRINVLGKNLANYSEKELDNYRLNQIGYIFQFFNLIPELTAEENISLPMEISGKSKKHIQERTELLLKLISLENRKNHYPSELSGGEQQRIAIAMALSNEPKILLCDEPTGELDSISKKSIMKLFQEIITLYPEKCILIVSHDPQMRYIADRLYHIRDGQITYVIEPDKSEKDKLKQYLMENNVNESINEELEHEIQETIFYLKNKVKRLKEN